MIIVPAYRNKWPHWTDYWFYHRVCSNEDVIEALTIDLQKAHILASEMTPMERLCLAEFWTGGADDIAAIGGFAMTSWW